MDNDAAKIPMAFEKKGGILVRRKVFKGALCIFLMAILVLTGCQAKAKSAEVSAKSVEDQSTSVDELLLMMDETAMLEHLKWLSKEDSGRIAGTEGEDATVVYLKDALSAMGYEVEIQSFPFLGYTLKSVSLEFKGVEGLPEVLVSSDDVHGLTYSASTPNDGITGELVDVGLGGEADFSGKKVEGKLVLIKRGGEFFYTKVQRAYTLGALGVIFYDPDGKEPVKATLVEPSQIPAVSVSTVIGESLSQMLLEEKRFEVLLKLDSEVKEALSENVIAILEASTDTDKRVVLGAHFDGVDTPAANDNGSGVVALMEVARLAMTKQDQLKTDLSFVFFGAEEAGLYGSTHYVEIASRGSLSNIVGMINLDMVGIGTELQVNTINQQDRLTLAQGAVEVAKTLDYPVVSLEMGRSDHVPFAESGIPSVMLAAGPFDNYHTDDDTAVAIDTAMLKAQIEWIVRMLHYPGLLDDSSEAVFGE